MYRQQHWREFFEAYNIIFVLGSADEKYLSQIDLKLFRKGGIHYFNNLMFNSKLSGKSIIE